VAITVYAGSAGLVLPSTSGREKKKINAAIDELQAGGSTAGGEGIVLAYKVAKENFISDGNNRVILATDGDFNVGVSSDDELVSLIERERESNVFLSVLGFGTGNYQDNKMQLLADKGNGNHSYIDNINEAKKVLVKEFGSTLFTIAKDVKFQIEFNPTTVQAYRLIGYENRMLAAEDFNDDKKDAGEVGSGHTVTALYEVIPAGIKNAFAKNVDPLKYQAIKKMETKNLSDDLFTIKLRYKQPEGNKSMLLTQPVRDSKKEFSSTSDNFKFSAAVAEFGLLLRNSEFRQNSSYKQVLNLATEAQGTDVDGYRKEFIALVKQARQLDN
jgi:Ca-activated chloride channel family protein